MHRIAVDRFSFAALALTLVGCDVTLARNLPRAEAEAWQRGLDRAGVVARLETEPAGSSTQRRMRIQIARTALPEAVAWAMPHGAREREADDALDSRSDAPLIESRAQERAREAATLARELERSIEELPGITRARVHLNLPAGSALLPESASPAAASVLLMRAADGDERGHGRVSGREPEVAAQARELVAGVVAGLDSSAVRVVESAAAGATAEPLRLRRVGPIEVTTTSAPLLRGFLVGSLLLHAVLASALLWPLTRRRRQHRPERASPD